MANDRSASSYRSDSTITSSQQQQQEQTTSTQHYLTVENLNKHHQISNHNNTVHHRRRNTNTPKNNTKSQSQHAHAQAQVDPFRGFPLNNDNIYEDDLKLELEGDDIDYNDDVEQVERLSTISNSLILHDQLPADERTFLLHSSENSNKKERKHGKGWFHKRINTLFNVKKEHYGNNSHDDKNNVWNDDNHSGCSSSSSYSVHNPSSPHHYLDGSFLLWGSNTKKRSLHNNNINIKHPMMNPYFYGPTTASSSHHNHNYHTRHNSSKKKKNKLSDLLCFLYTFHFLGAGTYDLFVSNNLWFSRQGLLLNPWIGPSPSTLIQFGALVPARVLYQYEYYRIFLISSSTLSCNLCHLIFNLMAIQLVLQKGCERRWGFQTTFWVYFLSVLFSCFVCLVCRPNDLTVYSSAGLLGCLATNTTQSFLSYFRDRNQFYDCDYNNEKYTKQHQDKKHHWFSCWGYLKPGINQLMIIILLSLGYFIPSIGLVTQLSGILMGYILGLFLFASMLQKDSSSHKTDNDEQDSTTTTSVSFAPIFGETLNISGILSPEYPITTRSLLLSPDNDDDDDDELKSDGSSSCASKKKGRWIRKLLRKKINLVHFIRFMSLIAFLSLFTLPLLIIAFASSTSSSSYLNLVQPLEYTVDPFLINCKFMNKMVLLSEGEGKGEQQNFNFICEETCVPYAGIKRVSNSGGMSLGTCNDVGYTCFQYYDTKTKRTQQDGYDYHNNNTTTWNKKNTMIEWMTGLNWNTEYQPSIGVYTNHSTMYCNTTTTTTTTMY